MQLFSTPVFYMNNKKIYYTMYYQNTLKKTYMCMWVHIYIVCLFLLTHCNAVCIEIICKETNVLFDIFKLSKFYTYSFDSILNSIHSTNDFDKLLCTCYNARHFLQILSHLITWGAIYKKRFYLFIWLCQVLVVVGQIFICGVQTLSCCM